MEAAEQARVSAEDFLEWVSRQDGRFELIDGFVVEMMAGAKQGHNVVVTNIVSAVGPQAKRGGCRTTASDTAVQTRSGTVRYPDVVVDCGPADPEAMVAENPTLVIEVSSPGTSLVDTTDKLDEYQTHPSVKLIMFVEPSVVSVKLYRLGAQNEWLAEKYERIEQHIELPEIGAVLKLREVYDTLAPRQRARLQLIEPASGPMPH